MNLISLVGLLEKQGLDPATAETVASMAQNSSVEEAASLLDGMLGPDDVQTYVNARKKAELKKLAIKEDTHGGVIQNGKFQPGIARNGIAVVSAKKKTPSKNSSQVSTTEKVDLVRDLEAALQSLSVNGRNRKACDCMGAKHGLLEMAPNCLNCGRIVCNKEGIGPCLFCEQPLLPNEQLEQLLRVLESQKLDVLSTMGKKALAAAGITHEAPTNLGRSSAQAQANLDRLLGYQENDAVRTRIIDQAGDADLPSSGVNRWATIEEQAEQLRLQQQRLRKLEYERKVRAGQGRKVLSIDVRGNRVFASVDDAPFESDDDEEQGETKAVVEGEEGDSVHYFDPKQFEQHKISMPPSKPELASQSWKPLVIHDPNELYE